jgi:mono/diheme cytochrome c family protein
MRAAWLALALCFVVGSTALAYTESQAERGAKVFMFYCSTCHGDRGQGLTDEFRATWPLQDQNCWTPKCHGLNHPPEGFVLPKYVQGVIGPGTLKNFTTAESLYTFIKLRMPYQNPHLLSEDERWAVTAFLLREHGVPGDGKLLDATTAASIRLRPETSPITPTISPTASPVSQAMAPATSAAPQLIASPVPSALVEPAGDMRWIWVLIAAALLGITVAVVRVTRSR